MKQYKALREKIRIDEGIVYYNAEKSSIGTVCMHCAMVILKDIYPEVNKIVIEKFDLIKDKYPKKTVYIHTNSKFGNMKKFTFKDIMEKRPLYMIRRVIASMLPKNKTRTEYIKKICI